MLKRSAKNFVKLPKSPIATLMFLIVYGFSHMTVAADPFALFRDVATIEPKHNCAISPYGASLVLALLATGAQDETEKEFKRFLGYKEDVEELAKSFNVRQYAESGSPLAVATSLWIQEDYPIRREFLLKNRRFFASRIASVDFDGDPDEACAMINLWVARRTKNRIPKLFDRLSKNNRLVAVSALYFLADWDNPFEASETRPADFTLISGKKIKVDMMSQEGRFGFLETDGSKMLSMPYKNQGYAATFILPKTLEHLDSLEKSLNDRNFADCDNRRSWEAVDVRLPRFTLEFEIDLSVILKRYLPHAFDANKADFFGIDGSRNLFIDLVLQKVFVHVDEKGTEAAAATAVAMRYSAAPGASEPPKPKIFHADRPFLFVIRKGNDILFVGRVMQPIAAGERRQ